LTAVDDEEHFLSRWSRRKLEAKQAAPAVLPAAELPAAEPAAAAARATEPEVPQGISAEYRKFFDPKVDEKLRQAALRGLFSDPHFNVMDGLDTYIDDYSIPDPIPAAMLRQLHQGKALFLFDGEAKEGAAAAGGASAEEGETAATPLESDLSARAELPAPVVATTDAEAANGVIPLGPVPEIGP
jgi:hypothetical protein